MASPSATSSLPDWIQLSPSVFLFKSDSQPTAAAPSSSTIAHANDATELSTSSAASIPPPLELSSPKLVVLMTWMSAQPSHINKYILGYHSLYPTTRILIVRSSPPDIFHRSRNAQRRRVAPAVSTIVASFPHTLPATVQENPEFILHIFSNGGSHQVRNLRLAYRETTSAPFPPHVTIFDSCPGRATFKRSVLALSSALPSSPSLRFPLLGLIYTIVSIYWLIFIPFHIPDPIERVRQALNDPELMEGEKRRCYMYSKVDPMVGWSDVEDHARMAAEECGFEVRKEQFVGSGHCAHVRGAERRYWEVVAGLYKDNRGR
uniref:Indole-diterpene biosynthesis protein PaxU n=1 Tax=Cladonia uncialis subsp. uncialis TaxID=180999 RepID=A0A1Z1CBI2_CLAUC|nr:hypothetical protein [Cladonia uncialis subsp. uncialis]AUW31395.1 hypothetical protein [Cladonia uncialis subsp. uncialis]